MLKTDNDTRIKEFIKYEKNSNVNIHILKSMFEYEKKIKREIRLWRNEDELNWLKSFNTISPFGLHSRISFLNKYKDFIKRTNKQLRVYKSKLTSDEVWGCIDIEKLEKLTLTDAQYNIILAQMQNTDTKFINTRDRLIMELAWLGLTNNEIKMLKKNDVKIVDDENEKQAVISLQNRNIVTGNLQTILDIETCFEEQNHIVNTKKNIMKVMKLAESNYLIRPVSIGTNVASTTSTIGNPSVVLKNVFIKNDIKCNGIDIELLSIESIRRSKICSLIHNEELDYVGMVNEFGIEQDCTYFIYRKISKLKYKD